MTKTTNTKTSRSKIIKPAATEQEAINAAAIADASPDDANAQDDAIKAFVSAFTGVPVAAFVPEPESAPQEAPKQETEAPAPVAVSATRFYLKDDHRPAGQGEMGKVRLFAHTAAFLEVSGLMEGKPVPSIYANRALGNTAMAHHASKFTTTAEGKMLTDEGKAFFAKRSVNQEFKAAYIKALTTGQPDGSMVKLAAAIGEFKA